MTKDQEIEMLKAHLAEAVGLLRDAVDDAKFSLDTGLAWKKYGNEIDEIEDRYEDFLARHAQAAEVHGDSHTPAQAEQQEAQGAQAGDETQEYILRAMGLNYSDRHRWDKLDTAAVIKAADEIARLRAALAIQPTIRQMPGRREMSEEIDWNKAAEGATHWAPATDRFCSSFMKLENGQWFCQKANGHGWALDESNDCPSRYIARPKR